LTLARWSGRDLPRCGQGGGGGRIGIDRVTTTFATRYFAVRTSTRPEARIEAAGELDLASVPIFQAAVRQVALQPGEHVVLDLRRLSFIDAAGLHAVLDLHEKCLNVSAALTIVPGPRHVQRVFGLAGADWLVPLRAETDQRRGHDGS
jgi:anti-anti-sigma factor